MPCRGSFQCIVGCGRIGEGGQENGTIPGRKMQALRVLDRLSRGIKSAVDDKVGKAAARNLRRALQGAFHVLRNPDIDPFILMTAPTCYDITVLRVIHTATAGCRGKGVENMYVFSAYISSIFVRRLGVHSIR